MGVVTAGARAIGGPDDVRLTRWARTILTRAVRGRLPEGTEWGEALLGEFEEVPTTAAKLRWTMSSLPLALRERRRAARGNPAARPPLRVWVTRRVVVSTILVLVVGLVVNWVFATIVDEPTASMEPTLRIGDRLLIDKVGFHLDGLHRGDIVLVRLPKFFPNGESIKRIVGMPGDVITCAGGGIYRDGVLVPARNKAFAPSPPPAPTNEGPSTCGTVTVPPGQIYLVGDNQTNSNDSQTFGPVPQAVVVGREVAVLWHGPS
jgi:signal peptidase I